MADKNIMYSQARSVAIFSSTHKYIWRRNVRKLREKCCVLYFFLEIVVWIQAKLGCGSSRMRPAAFFVLYWVQLSFISKEWGVFLCAVQTGRAHSRHLIVLPLWMCSIANDERRSSVIVFRSGIFNLFIKLWFDPMVRVSVFCSSGRHFTLTPEARSLSTCNPRQKSWDTKQVLPSHHLQNW